MLKTMSEAIEFYDTLNRAEDADYRFPVLKLRPDQQESSSLKEFGLPKSYLDFVCRYEIEDVSISFLNLGPIPSESLQQFLRDRNGMNANPYVPDNMLEVASFEADPLLVTKGSHGHSDGRVFYLDISTGYFPPPVFLAESFPSMVLTAANIEKLLRSDPLVNANDVELDATEVLNILRFVDPDIPQESAELWMCMFGCYTS
ncbi:hypothetical protein [Pseudophaeobacter flagellatus]|uniref:hypothetical protein n=1 Tax=Pseudophaeobacter flagellatus TaxID=2899119 RepID=UPI001E40AB1F|nr:hypothetical protein [Pseudophaeobacter flagellatus]MCD9146639.1 hypothetical protein [Pseudophaeobacter flagellatus]